MKNIRLAALVLLTFLGIHCKKSPTTFAGKIDVSGITTTDYSGAMTYAQVDNSDWTLNNPLTPEELDLFLEPTSYQLENTERGNVFLRPGFPNPNPANIFQFAASISRPTFVQLVIVDSMLSIKSRFFLYINSTTVGLNQHGLALTSLAYLSGSNYRMYYAFYSRADGIYYQGHGDFKVVK